MYVRVNSRASCCAIQTSFDTGGIILSAAIKMYKNLFYAGLLFVVCRECLALMNTVKNIHSYMMAKLYYFTSEIL